MDCFADAPQTTSGPLFRRGCRIYQRVALLEQCYGVRRNAISCFRSSRLKLQPELMARNGSLWLTGRREPARLGSLTQTAWIEHFFQTRNRAVMQIVATVPNTLQGRYFIETGTFSRTERQAGVRSY